MAIIDAKYFKEYREKLGFTNQNGIKAFFGAKDIVSEVDYKYLESLNGRLIQIVQKINLLVADEIKVDNFDLFCHENITTVFEKLKYNNIIVKLNNQGRRPEEVYFSWMRGFVISSYFLKALSQIFDVDIENIDLIGDDDFSNIETFKRTPKADLQINLQNGEKIRIEVQSGFQGINDIKQHKVIEAKKIKRDENIASLVIHFDLFNGQVAFVKIDEIDEDSVNWITRIYLDEGLSYNIPQGAFIWNIIQKPPLFSHICFE